MFKLNTLIKKINKKIEREKLNEKLNKSKLNNPTMLNWLWEFSKKIVIGIFVIYVITYLFSWILIFTSGIYNWNISYLDTLLTETNSTFKVIIGSYLIKSMFENVMKISKNNQTTEENVEINEEFDVEIIEDEEC